MADNAQTLALTVMAQMYRGDLVSQVNRQCTTLKVLKIVPGQGSNCAWVPEYDGAIAESYSEGADAANFGSDGQTAAILQWGQYRSNFHVSGLIKSVAASMNPASPAGNSVVVARNFANSGAKLASVINAALHSGDGTGKNIAGFGVALGSTSNTYAGIDRSSASYFRPIISDPGSLTIPTFASIRKHQGLIFDACGEMPDIALCPTAVFDTIGGLFDASKNYTVDTVNTARGKIILDAGYEGIRFNGTVFLKDKDAVANKIVFLNTRHAEIEVLPAAVPGLAEVMESLRQRIVIPDDGFGMVPLNMAFEPLAKLGDSERVQVKTYLQLKIDRPNSCGMMLNVGTTN